MSGCGGGTQGTQRAEGPPRRTRPGRRGAGRGAAVAGRSAGGGAGSSASTGEDGMMGGSRCSWVFMGRTMGSK